MRFARFTPLAGLAALACAATAGTASAQVLVGRAQDHGRAVHVTRDHAVQSYTYQDYGHRDHGRAAYGPASAYAYGQGGADWGEARGRVTTYSHRAGPVRYEGGPAYDQGAYGGYRHYDYYQDVRVRADAHDRGGRYGYSADHGRRDDGYRGWERVDQGYRGQDHRGQDHHDRAYRDQDRRVWSYSERQVYRDAGRDDRWRETGEGRNDAVYRGEGWYRDEGWRHRDGYRARQDCTCDVIVYRHDGR